MTSQKPGRGERSRGSISGIKIITQPIQSCADEVRLSKRVRKKRPLSRNLVPRFKFSIGKLKRFRGAQPCKPKFLRLSARRHCLQRSDLVLPTLKLLTIPRREATPSQHSPQGMTQGGNSTSGMTHSRDEAAGGSNSAESSKSSSGQMGERTSKHDETKDHGKSAKAAEKDRMDGDRKSAEAGEKDRMDRDRNRPKLATGISSIATASRRKPVIGIAWTATASRRKPVIEIELIVIASRPKLATGSP